VKGQRSTQVGRFTYDVVAGTWEWDDEVFRIHGLDPGSITPTTDYVLNCKHPEDRERVAAVLAQTSTTGRPFSISYRLIDANSVERRVVLVCEGGVCEGDTVTSIDGYYIDLTDDFRAEGEVLASQAIAASVEHRATIEQAKGSLMFAYGLDADQAFAMLGWWSSHHQVKVRDLAARLVDTMESGSATSEELRLRFDALLHDVAAPPPPGEPAGQPAAPVPD
jgi:hypothetical protein